MHQQFLFYFLKCILLFLTANIYALSKNPVTKQEFIFSSPPFKSCHASTIVESNNNNLLCAFFAGEDEGTKGVGIWMCRYTQGKWSAPYLIASDKNDLPCWNPVLFAFDKEILLFYKVGPSPTTWSGVLKRSLDNGKTWKEEEPLPAGIYGPIKNKPYLTKEGTLLCGTSVQSYHRWGCYVEITQDKGKSWKRSPPINLSHDYFGMIQPTIVKMSNNIFLLLARTRQSGRIAKAISHDYGKTWSQPTLTLLPNPNSGIDAINLRDGRLLLVYNHSSKKRTPLNIAISSDNGVTWKNVLTLEHEPGAFSYPAVIQKNNGDIFITYTWNRVNIKAVTVDPKRL